jgi:hypothetical protein
VKTEMSHQFRDLQKLQTDINALPLDKQESLQLLLRRAEKLACRKLKEEQRKGVGPETYAREGGASFLAFVLQFERYCASLAPPP